MSSTPSPRAAAAIGDGFRRLLRPPFRVLVAVLILISITNTTFSNEPSETEILFSVILLIASIYLQLAVILAAGRSEPEPSADLWLRGAVKRRCFWRFLATSLLVVLGLFAGAVLLVVGLFFVGALVALAQSAVVLERRLPLEAITRSAEIAGKARMTTGIVFALMILVPTATSQTVLFMEWTDELGLLWPVILVVAELLVATGLIALTRIFVALGGDPTPPHDQLAPAPRSQVTP